MSQEPRGPGDPYSRVEYRRVIAWDRRIAREGPFLRRLLQSAPDRSVLDRAYADAMRELHGADPSDVDAATLFAEALMDLYPWAYWTSEGEPREFTEEIVATLEQVLDASPNHVGANHYYIHAVEEFFPEPLRW